MRNLNIGVVSEGPTDYELIYGLIQFVIPGEHRILPIQPDNSATAGIGSDYGPTGSGWTGVQKWCESIVAEFGGIDKFIRNSYPALDMLIIQIDSDIARDGRINCYGGCPPSETTVTNLKSVIANWLGISKFPDEVVLCIPADNIETWILCAFDPETSFHNPPEKHIECLQEPEWIISEQSYNKPKQIIRRKNGRPKKSASKYRQDLVPVVVENWEKVKSICPQAKVFEDNIQKFRI